MQLMKTVGGDRWNGNRNNLEAPDWDSQESWLIPDLYTR